MKENYTCSDCLKLVVVEDLKTKYFDDPPFAKSIVKSGLCEDCIERKYPFMFLHESFKRLNEAMKPGRLPRPEVKMKIWDETDTFKFPDPGKVYDCGCNQDTFYSSIPVGKYKFLPYDIPKGKAIMYKEEPKMFISRKPYGGETYKCCKCDNNFQEGAATFYREGTNDPIIGVSIMAKSGNRNQLYLCPDCIESVFEALGKAVQIGEGM